VVHTISLTLLTLKRSLEGLCIRLSVCLDECHASTAALAKTFVQRKLRKPAGTQIGNVREASCYIQYIHQFIYKINFFALQNSLNREFPCSNVNRICWEAASNILCVPKGRSDGLRLLDLVFENH
jgi:hypothetical protein